MQGADLAKAADKTAPRVEIIRHPDVRRMLMLQKAHAEGLRALVLWTAHVQDQVALAAVTARRSPQLESLNDLLAAARQGLCARRRSTSCSSLSLQCFGGSGYCQDYPIEQYIRDQKIDSLYEGTTHIQALDLFFRKIGRDRGATLNALLAQVKATADALPADLGVEKAALQTALADTQGIMGAMLGKLGQSVYHVGVQGNRILFALAELVIGWRLAVGAQVALARSGPRRATTRRSIEASSRPRGSTRRTCCRASRLTRKLVEAGDLDVMELPDDSW